MTTLEKLHLALLLADDRLREKEIDLPTYQRTVERAYERARMAQAEEQHDPE